jgi:arginine N-succinyltransferase
MIARTEDVTSVRNAKSAMISALGEGETKAIISRGKLGDFQATYAMLGENDDGVVIDEQAAANIGLSVGDEIRYIPR